jgi:hypothetical protein
MMSVTKLEITSRRLAGRGQAFGTVGTYEHLEGRARFAIDPEHPLDSCITDIKLAPRGPDGLVHFSATFSILKPFDQQRGSRRLLIGVPNRGHKVTGLFNSAFQAPGQPEPEDGPDLGDGSLMRNGYTVAECGWEWGLPSGRGQMTIDLPEAIGHEGPVAGKVMLDWQPSQECFSLPFAHGLRFAQRLYPTMDVDDPEASLLVRDNPMAPGHDIERHLWRFARQDNGKIVPDATTVYLSTGFQRGKIYQLVYRARGAPVLGLGLLGIRDIASFLRYSLAEEGNPCADGLDYAYAYGISQTGSLLRHFLYLGLNEDERERLVFDGILTLIAGPSRSESNMRLGVGSGGGSTGAASTFPHAFGEETDPVSGKTDGLLNRLALRNKVPKIFQANSANEYWRKGASLIHADARAGLDLKIPDSVRIYLMAGAQHAGGSSVLSTATMMGDRLRYPANMLDYGPLVRAMLHNLDRWASEDVDPPRSSYPRIADGTAVPPMSLEQDFSALPGVVFPKHLPRISHVDFGPGSTEGIPASLPGVNVGEDYSILVSALDADRNEVAGLRLPDLTVPLATYAGWNLRDLEAGGEGQIAGLSGSTFPFARDARERNAVGDPRPSISERYSSRQEYLTRFREATMAMVHVRQIPAEDVERMVEGAARRYDLFTGTP